MFAEPHDLHHELPEYADRIHQLKTHDTHFRRLFEEYDDVVKEL
ncbi:MAG: GTP-binding protein, partial [Gammaproteobacteria bacterium]